MKEQTEELEGMFNKLESISLRMNKLLTNGTLEGYQEF